MIINQAKEGGFANSSRQAGPGKLRALALIAMATATALTSTGCSPAVDSVKSLFVEEAFPSMPIPEISTYILDLSGSTYPLRQLKALGSGIEETISGASLGDPFRSPKRAPESLSIQFITANSANGGRISLVSANTGVQLYDWVRNTAPNIDQAKPLWAGFVRARQELSQSPVNDLASCQTKAIEYFGQQGLSKLALSEPAKLICLDIAKTRTALDQLNEFVTNPTVPMGSDVFGAVEMGINNLKRAEMQYPISNKVLVIASDLIDQSPGRQFVKQIRNAGDDEAICSWAKEELANKYGSDFPFQDLTVVLVGQSNSRADLKLLNQVRKYWKCFFEHGGASVIETTDLNNY